MLDSDGYTAFIRNRVLLEAKLAEIGDYRGSSEIESQMMFIETRLAAKIKQAHMHAVEEMHGLKMVLLESTKEDSSA